MMNATITLPDELVDALETYRQERCLPDALGSVMEAIVREYLTSHGYLMPKTPRRGRISVIEHGSGPRDVSVKHDHYLAEDVWERKAGGSR